MSESETTEFVGREEDIQALKDAWDAAASGKAQTHHVTAPLNGGKHVLVSSACRYAHTNTASSIVIRTALSETATQNIMLALYSSLYSGVLSKPELKGKVEMVMTMRAASAGERTKRWLENFVNNIKSIQPTDPGEQHKVNIPQDNPLLGYIEIISVLASEFPVLLDFRGVHNVYSLPFFTTINALHSRAHSNPGLNLMLVLQSEGVPGNENWIAPPFQLFLEQYSAQVNTLVVEPWNTAETTKYLESKSYSLEHAAKITELNSGRPVLIAEMAKWAEDDAEFAAKLPELTLETLADSTPDASELEEDSEEPAETAEGEAPKPRQAGVNDAEDIAYLAALMGVSFPSEFIARMGNYKSDSIDDLLDASAIYDELQRSEPLNSWIYRFSKSIYRDSVLARHTDDKDKAIAKNVAQYYERVFAGLGPGFLTKTIRMYADVGETARAEMLINRALLAEEPQWWQAIYEIIKSHGAVDWETRLIRTTYLRLGEIAAGSFPPDAAEKLIQEGIAWVDEQSKKVESEAEPEAAEGADSDDTKAPNMAKVYKATRGLMLNFGSQLDERRQDKYRARSRAQQALEIFRELEDTPQIGEGLCRLARIELIDGQLNAAQQRVEEAEEAVGELAAVRSHTFFLRGLLLQRQNQLADAEKAFAQSNQLAGHPQVQRAPMALDAGLKLGEVLAQQKKLPEAADVLSKVTQMAQGLRNGAAEHMASRLLTQIRDALKQFEGALSSANRCIQLSQGMRRADLLVVDVNTCGVLNLKLGKNTEGVALFQNALKIMRDSKMNNVDLQREVLFNLGEGQRKIGENKAAKSNLESAIQIAGRQINTLQKSNKQVPAQFVQRLIGMREAAGKASRDSGDKSAAKQHFEEGIKMAEAIKDKETRKRLKSEVQGLR